MEMLDGNSAAELNHDHAMSMYANSSEYRAAQLLLKDKRANFISSLLKNVDCEGKSGMYSLSDCIDCIDADSELWNERIQLEFGGAMLNTWVSVGECYEFGGDDVAKLYVAGKLSPSWRTEITKKVELMADMAVGE